MEPGNDTRNVIDEFKGLEIKTITAKLDTNGIELEIAVENVERDFNMGTIVRNANAFGVRRVHVIGSKQWNKRGAMMTDKYLTIEYHDSVNSFSKAMHESERPIIAIDNVEGSEPLHEVILPRRCVLVFGAEGPGISSELMSIAQRIVAIEQFGSTRSVNVGVASGIVMYQWLAAHKLT